MKWFFTLHVHVFGNQAQTSHETIVIKTVYEETKLFSMKILEDAAKVEVEKRGKIFDYIVISNQKPYFEDASSKKTDFLVSK